MESQSVLLDVTQYSVIISVQSSSVDSALLLILKAHPTFKVLAVITPCRPCCSESGTAAAQSGETAAGSENARFLHWLLHLACSAAYRLMHLSQCPMLPGCDTWLSQQLFYSRRLLLHLHCCHQLLAAEQLGAAAAAQNPKH